MGYRGRGWSRNRDMEVDASDASWGQFIRTRRGDDKVTGSDHGDLIFTGRGDDTVEGGGGNDILFGGRGTDTAIFSGSVLDYKILSFGCGRWNFVQGADGCDFLHSFEVLQFDDFTLDLRSNNDPLVILRDEGLETAQGEPLRFQVDFYDIDGSSVELVSATVTGGGTLTTQNTGVSQVGQIGVGGGTSVTFDPGNAYDSLGAGESTTETVTLVISDGQGGTTTVSYEILIEGQNDAPLALAVSAIASEDSPVVVAADYSDIDTNDVLSVSIDTTGTLGTVTDNGDGTFGYDPSGAFESLAAGETATDTFTYTVDDGNGGTDTETVTITIQGENDAPVALAVVDTADEDGPAITVAANVSDVDASDTHTFSVDSTGTQGSVTNNGDGTFDYDPNGAFESLAVGETATDTFTYTVDDGNGGTDTETVTITVTGQNDAPVALAVAETADEDGPAITVSANVSDVDASDTHTFSVDTSGTQGSVTNNGDGTFDYDPNGAFESLAVGETATDTFTYTVDDGNGGTDTETVTITVTGTNDAPVAEAVTAQVVEASETSSSDSVDTTSLIIPNRGRFYTYDFDTGIATTVARDTGANNTYGQVAAQVLSEGNGIVVQANPNNSGWGFGGEVFVDGVATPINSADYVITGGNGLVDASNPLFLLFADSNRNIDSIELSITDLDLGGGVTVNAQMSLGPLDYEVFTTDDLRVDGATFSSTLSGPEPTVTVAADFADVDSDTFTFSVDTAGTVGSVVNNGDGTFTYSAGDQFESLAAGETATDSFTYTVDDGDGGTDTETVTITVQGRNDAPVALAVADTADEDGPAITVAANVSDVDASDTHTFSVDTSGTQGSVTNNGDGTFDYDPNGAFESLAVGETATDTFSYTADDGNGGTDTETVTITVTGQNDAPVALAVAETADEDGPAITVSANISDVDASDTHTFSVDTTGTQGSVTNNGDGTFDYDPNGAFESLAVGETATDTFSYTADDGNGGTDTETVTITVTGQNDAPVALAVAGTADEDGPAITVSANFSDVDASDTHTFSVDTSGTLGSVTNNGDGTFDYDPNGAFESLAVGETATDTFSYTVDDGNGGTDTETVTITVQGANDAPVITSSSAQQGVVRGAVSFGDQLDAAELFSLYDGTPGAATLQTVGGQEALRVGPQAIGRVPHTTIELFAAGELSADDVVSISLNSQNTRTGGDQDTFIGLTDNARHLTLFTADQPGALLATDFIEGSGNLGDGFPVIPTVTDRTIVSLPQRLDNFGVEFELDGGSDHLTLLSGGAGSGNIISGPTQGTAGDWLDPSLGLNLVLTNDGANETFYYNSLDFTVEVAARSSSGQITFSDADTSDTHSASVTNVALSGEVGSLTAADVQSLLTLSTSSSATGGSVDWDFPAPGSAFDYLADGETLELAYTVTIDDGNGGTVQDTVTITVQGTNDAPVAQAVTAQVAETPQTFSTDSVDTTSLIIPNRGRFYTYDFDTGIATSVARDTGANNTYGQVAAQVLSEGNGIVVQANPNNSGWGFGGEVFVDGVATPINSADYVITGGNGLVDASNPLFLLFADSNRNIDSIELSITDLDLGGGVTVNAQMSLGPLDYEVFTTDDLRVDGATFSSTLSGPAPTVTVAADFADVDSDTFTFSVDTTGTVGSVVNNGDGTFTYSADDMFEHLNTGETATDSFTYTVDDGAGGLDTETVTITVIGQDDFLFA